VLFMATGDSDTRPAPSIADLYPTLSDEERAEAKENLDRYLALALRILERLHAAQHGSPLDPQSGVDAETPRSVP